jgi:DNA-binding CsgD family transcriptional regulator
LARSAYMLGRDDDYASGLERAHHAHVAAGDIPRAVRCAIWAGHSCLFRGEIARATGWFARARRLLDEDGRDCVERGYLLIPVWLQQMGEGDHEAGYVTAAEAAEIGERFGDPDLIWLARHDQGRALVKQGRVEEGLRVVDEALVVATAGELSPIVTGIVYCNTISFCRDVYEMRHVQEWTEALTEWCERQPQMVTHNGLCFVHRAEIRLLRGDWDAALEEARHAATRFTEGILNQIARGRAFYLQGDTHRLRGEFAAAEEAYRQANEVGYQPQPGLALLRLAQGNADAAVGAIRRVVGETTEPLERAGLLPAYVEIMLAAGDPDLAHAACRELDEIAQRWGSEVLTAMAGHARGAVALHDGAASDALVALRRALAVWNGLAAPFEAARVRLLLAAACRALGDEDTAALERQAARSVFDAVGAAGGLGGAGPVDVATQRAGMPEGTGAHGLSRREIEVLRIVAEGKSNRDIASELVISERTVARHVQNIFHKLGVSSRTEAAAFAFSRDLV